MTGRGSARVAARAGPLLGLLVLLLFLPEGAAAYDIPHRDYYENCSWWELRGAPAGRISYDVSDNVVGWKEGVENWDAPLGFLMHFNWYSYPHGKTHLRWEGEPPLYDDCYYWWAWGCWMIRDEWCLDGHLTEAVIYFNRSNYLSAIEEDRIAASAHEWGHNLNLGDYDPARYFCDLPPRVMGWPDGQGCITGPSCPEQAAVIDLYWLTPWWPDRDGDCFNNGDEDFMGTDDWDDCPDNSSHDAWPPDFNMDTSVNVLDLMMFRDPLRGPYDPRYDLNTDGSVNVLDVMKMKPYITVIKRCTNP